MGDVCIVGGGPKSGDVFVRGRPVCDNDWDIKDAQVVCKSLNLGDAIGYNECVKTLSLFVNIIDNTANVHFLIF